ncbi:hypothetical protein TeGR_g11590 [Tetraparma gracilis]|uniref:Uncharacterized protein n=1 Tax=Tetraparma gracilis TaxID=2962635 RepID=A0ABQ6MYH1_9STRA|nr:hypothetical protein TeGR_g11590 [Tetraparma gracilis]
MSAERDARIKAQVEKLLPKRMRTKTKEEAATPAVDNSVCVRVAVVSEGGARKEHDVPQGHRLIEVCAAHVLLGSQYVTFGGELILAQDTPLRLGLVDGDELLLVSRTDHLERLMDFIGRSAGTERCGFALLDMKRICVWMDTQKLPPPSSVPVDFVTALAAEFDPESHPPIIVWLAKNVEGGADRICENKDILDALFMGLRSADALGLKLVGASSEFSVQLNDAMYVLRRARAPSRTRST